VLVFIRVDYYCKLTGVTTPLSIVAVDVTVLVAVGVRKHVHALLIFAVKAFPDSLHPATRLLGTLWMVSRLFKGL
jgi:hypothetical protein